MNEKILRDWDNADQYLKESLSFDIDNIKNTSVFSRIEKESVFSNASSVEFVGVGKELENYKIIGNSVQNGIPSYTSPVEVEGVGNKRWNEFDSNIYEESELQINSLAKSIQLRPNTTYIVTSNCPLNSTGGAQFFVAQVGESFSTGTNGVYIGKSRTITTPDNGIITVGARKQFDDPDIAWHDFWYMIEEGNDTKEYVPFSETPKYHIPISCNGETTTIVLDKPLYDGDELDYATGKIARKTLIKKYDGSNADLWEKISSTANVNGYVSYLIRNGDVIYDRIPLPICDKLPYDSANQASVSTDSIFITTVGQLAIRLPATVVPDLNTFKQWISDNPITIYKNFDNISSVEEIELPTISTADGLDTFAVETTVEPIETSITVYGDYVSEHKYNEGLKNIRNNILPTITAASTASAIDRKSVVFSGTGKTLENLKVGGRTVQDGVPTPDAPVEVLGVGDEVNLFNIDDVIRDDTYYLNDDGVETSDGYSGHIKNFIKINPNHTCTIMSSSTATFRVYFYDVNKQWLGRSSSISSKYAFKRSDVYYIQIQYLIASSTLFLSGLEIYNDKYKIPVSCNREITNIYLDSPLFEGESTDLVGGKVEKKTDILKYDGTESGWEFHSVNANNIAIFRCLLPSTNYVISPLPLSNRLPYAQVAIAAADSNSFGVNTSENKLYVRIQSSVASTLDELKSWLSNNNLQVVFYKNIPTTESFDTSPIPTASGNNELIIDTEVTPANIDVTSFGDYYSKAEVDKMIPRISMLTYVGTGGTNTIKFPLFPTRIISMSGMAIDNNYIQSYPCDPKRVDSIKSKYYGGHMGEVSCSLSYDESESSITLTGGVDDGARFNVLGETYVVIYTY